MFCVEREGEGRQRIGERRTGRTKYVQAANIQQPQLTLNELI